MYTFTHVHSPISTAMSLGTWIALLNFSMASKGAEALPTSLSVPRVRPFWRGVSVPNALQPYLMVVTYSLITLLGQAIELVWLFNPSSNYDLNKKRNCYRLEVFAT